MLNLVNAGSRPVGCCLDLSEHWSFPGAEDIYETNTHLASGRPALHPHPFRLLLAGADIEARSGSANCFRFCVRVRALSPLGVPLRTLGPLGMPRLSKYGTLLAPGKKSRNAEDKSGASLEKIFILWKNFSLSVER